MTIELDNRDDNLVNKITIKIIANPFKKHYLNDEDERLWLLNYYVMSI